MSFRTRIKKLDNQELVNRTGEKVLSINGEARSFSLTRNSID